MINLFGRTDSLLDTRTDLTITKYYFLSTLMRKCHTEEISMRLSIVKIFHKLNNYQSTRYDEYRTTSFLFTLKYLPFCILQLGLSKDEV